MDIGSARSRNSSAGRNGNPARPITQQSKYLGGSFPEARVCVCSCFFCLHVIPASNRTRLTLRRLFPDTYKSGWPLDVGIYALNTWCYYRVVCQICLHQGSSYTYGDTDQSCRYANRRTEKSLSFSCQTESWISRWASCSIPRPRLTTNT